MGAGHIVRLHREVHNPRNRPRAREHFSDKLGFFVLGVHGHQDGDGWILHVQESSQEIFADSVATCHAVSTGTGPSFASFASFADRTSGSLSPYALFLAKPAFIFFEPRVVETVKVRPINRL